jgi:hypothetical protein
MADPSPETRAAGWAPWSGPALLVLFLLTLVLLPVGPGWSEFWTDPGTRLWHILVSVQVPLWAAALAWGWRPLFHHDSPWAREKSVWLWPRIHALLFAIAACLPIYRSPVAHILAERSKLPYHEGKLLAVTLMGVSVAALQEWGLLSAHGEASNELARLDETLSRQALTQVVARYLQLRSRVQGFVSWVGAIIGVATLATGCLRNSVDSPEFPPEFVIVYGLYFTILLALVFLPALYSVQALGTELARRLSRPEPLPSESGDWKHWSEEQNALAGYLGLQQNPLQVMQSALSVLAPLVGSVSGVVLQK